MKGKEYPSMELDHNFYLMGYRNYNITTDSHLQKNSDNCGEHASGNFKSPKGDQLIHDVVQPLNLKGSVINVTTDNDVVSVIINKHDHTSLCCQPVIQNDLWAHPTALNKIVARAVEGKKTDIQYYHKNYLDHVYAVSDDNGNLVEHYRYTAFGEPEIYSATGAKRNTSAIGNTVMWNTRRYDADNGLYYYKYRHYAANIGRWLGRDPLGDEAFLMAYVKKCNEGEQCSIKRNRKLAELTDEGQKNLYVFVGNMPVNMWDKHGLARLVCTLYSRSMNSKGTWICKYRCRLWTLCFIPGRVFYIERPCGSK